MNIFDEKKIFFLIDKEIGFEIGFDEKRDCYYCDTINFLICRKIAKTEKESLIELFEVIDKSEQCKKLSFKAKTDLFFKCARVLGVEND